MEGIGLPRLAIGAATAGGESADERDRGSLNCWASLGKMEEVVGELGLGGLNKDRVIRMTKALDDELEAFQNWPLRKWCAYVWLDAPYQRVRQHHRALSWAFVLALRPLNGPRMPGLNWSLGVAAGFAV